MLGPRRPCKAGLRSRAVPAPNRMTAKLTPTMRACRTDGAELSEQAEAGMAAPRLGDLRELLPGEGHLGVREEDAVPLAVGGAPEQCTRASDPPAPHVAILVAFFHGVKITLSIPFFFHTMKMPSVPFLPCAGDKASMPRDAISAMNSA